MTAKTIGIIYKMLEDDYKAKINKANASSRLNPPSEKTDALWAEAKEALLTLNDFNNEWGDNNYGC